MKKRNLFKRMIASILACLLAVPSGIASLPLTASAAGTSSSSPISISLDWVDSEFKNGSEFNLTEDEAVSNAVTMKVSYESDLIREEGYAPGELIITVKGIGNVNRAGAIEALVGADKVSDSVKTRDWSYTWNSADDTYTLTNNEEIKGNSVFSGYFELVWNIKARDSIDGYQQSGMVASLYVPEGDVVSSNTLKFTNETKADTFAVHIDLHEMYSYEGLTGGISNPNDYAFVRYNLGASDFENSRGLKSTYYVLDPDAGDVGSGAIIISPVLNYQDNGDGTYQVAMTSLANMIDQYIFVAYPKSSYGEKTITASITKYGAYYEGDDAGNTGTQLLAVDSISVPIPNDFSFADLPGDIYDFWKDTYYDKYVSSLELQEKGGDVSGPDMKTGTTETFYLEGLLNNPDGVNYAVEIVDDFLYILKNNGDFRQLEAGEYTFSSVTVPASSTMLNTNNIPIAKDVYKVYIYAASDGAKIAPGTGAPVWTGLITDSIQYIELPANTTAFAFVIQDLAESVHSISIPVEVKFNIKDTSSLAFEEQDNLTSGQVVNTSFIRLHTKQSDGSYSWFNDSFTASEYKDDTNLGLAQKDIDTYGAYLDRERDNITFYAGEKNEYDAYTAIEELTAEGGSVITRFSMGGNFKFLDNEYPNKFSVYTVLDESLSLYGYRLPEDIWDIMELTGFRSLSEEQLADACTPEVILNYKDSERTYIALHFDFGDLQLPQDSTLWAHFKVKVDKDYIKKSYTIRARSAIIMDKPIDTYPTGKVADNGNWADDAALFTDIDRDGDASELLSYDFDSVSNAYADSSQLLLTKYVKTTYSDGWVQLPDVPQEEYGGLYQYDLYLQNGNSQATNIIVRDVLETGANMQWQGTFQSVDLSECEDAGVTGVVYYSASSTPSSDLGSSDWSTTKPASVKAIAVDFGDSVLKEGQELNIIVNMKAPEDTSLKDKITENGFSASFTMTDSGSGNVTKYDDLASNFVQVKLTPPLRSIIVSKTDETSGAKLSEAKFALIDKATGETVEEVTSNERGYAIFRDLPVNTTYILEEKEAPYGYEAVEDIEIVLGTEDYRVTVKDPRKTGSIEVYKVNSFDNDLPVKDAEYTLYNADGDAVATAVTDAAGLAVFTDVPWGSYTVKETVSPAGFQLNKTEYSVKIDRDNVSQTAVIETVDVQEKTTVKLNKYVSTVAGVQTEIPLSGATFELVRKYGESTERVGLYVTDSEGEIFVEDLPYGNYYFREYRTPKNYITAENVEFTLSSDNKNAVVSVYNQRKPGSVIITKKDNLGNFIEGVEFSLYAQKDSSAQPVATAKTDEYGVAQFSNLEWGSYYILETDAPDYYEIDAQWKEVNIDAKTLSATLDVINNTVKGSVVLIKTDEAGRVFLPGAEYTLYKDNGTVIDDYTTDASGKITVEDLEWGSYYFKETKAPDGYSLSDETVRFSVNSLNAGITQEIWVTDPLDAKSITLTKRIRASDINFDNGNPTFIFKVEGTDINDNDHTYYRVVTFDESYVKANTASDGYVSLSTTISNIVAGTYTATEEETSRYCLVGISDAVNGTVNGDAVTFDLSTTDKKQASAVFTNRNYEQQDFSDAQVLTNVLKKKAKLTALDVSYGADTAEAESAVDTSLLTVTAYYDDGTSKELTDSEYVLDITTFPNVNGDYTVTVSYKENGITRRDTFKVTLYGMKLRIVDLEVDVTGDTSVQAGSEIDPDMFTVTAVYNDGTEETIADYIVSPSTAPTVTGDFDVTISLDLNAVPNGGQAVTETVTMTAEYPEPVLMKGGDFNSQIPSTATAVVFTDETAPSGATLTDVSAAGDGSVMAWLDGTTFKVSSQRANVKVIANESCYTMFWNETALTSINGAMLDTSRVTTMNSMFSGCTNLTTLNMTGWDTSEVTNMNSTFKDCSSLTSLNVSGFNTEKVTLMSNMFSGCSKLTALDVSKFKTPNVTSMSYMFYHCSGLTALDVSGWITDKVGSMSNMFNGCSSITALDVDEWNTAKVTNMHSMFQSCNALAELDVSGFTTDKVTDMGWMFFQCYKVPELDVSGWNTAKVTDFDSTFYGCYALSELDVSGFDTSSATNMKYMFMGLNVTYLDVSDFKTGKVTDMSAMFQNCNDLTELDVSKWDTSNVTSTTHMFYDCPKLTVLDVSGFNTSKVTGMRGMFNLCTGVKALDVSKWDTRNVETMDSVFYGCKSLTTLDVSNWNTGNVTSMMSIFFECENLISIDCSKWNTSKVTDMHNAFEDCQALKSLDLTGWDTSNATNMDNMFRGCYEVTTAYARTQADAARLNATKNKPTTWEFISLTPIIDLTVNCPDTVTVDIPDVVDGGVTELTVVPVDASKVVTSFKLDGVSVYGDTFTAPAASGSVTITDVVLMEPVIIESEHNPYPNEMYNTTNGIEGQVYGEATFEDAVSLKVELDYQTESAKYDWICLYDADGNLVDGLKYGGSTRTQKTIIVPGNYVKIVFRTDDSGNDFYGFLAKVTPIYQ